MNLQQFDSTLKSALDNLEVPYDASTWSALESRLNAMPAPDAVDKVVFPALEKMEMPYDAGTWSSLADRMDGLYRVRRLRMTKMAEAAIFLLLLLNLKGFFGVVEAVTHPAPAKNEIREPIAKSRHSKIKKTEGTQVQSGLNAENSEQQSLAQQLLALVQNVAGSLTDETERNLAELAANTPLPSGADNSVLDPGNFYTQSGIVKFPIGPVLPVNGVSPVLYAGTHLLIPGIETTSTAKASRFYATSYVSFDKNYLRENAYSDKKSGYGGGFSVGYRKGKWGVEAGLQYSEKNYQPKFENVTYQNDLNGISLYHIENVDAEVFSVPVKGTRRVVKFRNTSAHAVAGVTANFATSKRYAYDTEHYPPSQSSGTPIVAPLPNGKGIFENGGLSRNAYATADLGLRVEQSLGKRYIAFVEPVFRQSLGGGLGPSSSRLSTFSLQAGVMASL